MLTLIHNPNCSKSRAVLKILENSKQPFSIVEYLNEPISFQTLDKILRLLNMQPQEIVRRSEDEFESIRNEIPATGSVDERKRWIELLIRYASSRPT